MRTNTDTYIRKLTDFINTHGRYPKVDDDRQLYCWVLSQRAKKNRNVLTPAIENKLIAIGFVWNGRLRATKSQWMDNFSAIKTLLQNQVLPTIKENVNLYNWLGNQFRLLALKNPKLNNERREKLQELLVMTEELKKARQEQKKQKELKESDEWNEARKDFMKNYVATDKWDEMYLEFAAFIAFHKRRPTVKNSHELQLHAWLGTQRHRYDRGTLTEEQYQKLTGLGIVFNPQITRNELLNKKYEAQRKKVWDKKYKALVEFRLKNQNRWPGYNSDGIEKELYEWCKIQRQLYSGATLRKKQLSQQKIDKFNQIGFPWGFEDELSDKS